MERPVTMCEPGPRTARPTCGRPSRGACRPRDCRPWTLLARLRRARPQGPGPTNRACRVGGGVATVLLITLALLTVGCGEQPSPKSRQLTIVATGLLKGNLYPQTYRYSRGRTRVLGGFASLFTKIREISAARAGRGGVVLVDVGGNLAGSAESHASQGQIVVEMMNRLPYAASLVSNLEFAYGPQALQSAVAKARFPFLSSNLTFEGGGLSRLVRREVRTQIDGLTVALLGVSPPNLLSICPKEDVAGITVDPDPGPVLDAAARVRKSGASLVVLLAKIPVDRPPAPIKDAIAKSDVDLVVGVDYGRSSFSTERWGKTYVAGVPADNRGSRVLIVDLQIGEGQVSAESSVEIVAPEESRPDPPIKAELEEYESRALKPFGVKLGSTSTALSRPYKAESTLGDLVTDAMREATGAGLALLNAGATQDDLVAGEIALRDLFRVLPFDDTMVTTRITGRQIEALIQEPLGRGSWYHISGGSYRVRESAQGIDRLLSIGIGGRPASPTATYLLATTDYIMKRTPVLVGARATACGSLREAVAAYVKRQPGPVARSVEQRVVFERALR